MTDDLTAQLKRWGMATVNRYAANEDGPSKGDSVLGRTFKVANGKKLDRDLLKRDGSSRRAIMAREAPGLHLVPKWACDPIPARNDAARPFEHERARVDLGIPDDLRWIDRALAQMSRQHPVRAMCIREEFTGQGTQRMKAGRVQSVFGGKFTVWMYRKELDRGLEWMRGSKAA